VPAAVEPDLLLVVGPGVLLAVVGLLALWLKGKRRQ
jgi:hypothetical protein